MTSTPHFEAIFTAAAVVCVGGWGLLAFRHAELLARINVRFGIKWISASLIRKMAIVEIVLASLSVATFIIRAAFGMAKF